MPEPRMVEMTLWELHGLVVSSPDVALDARPAIAGSAPDVRVELKSAAQVLGFGQTSPGRVIAYAEVGPGLALSVAEVGRGVVIYFHGYAEVTLNLAGTTVDIVLAPNVDPALASVWLGGTVIAVLLALRGHPVLHASAVTVDTRSGPLAIAFVGRSGMGKSTMATLACRDGAHLLADDVLRTDLVEGGLVMAWPGATTTRLRPAARDLSRHPAVEASVTADGRYAASLSLAGPMPTRLGAIVVPSPDRSAGHVEVTRLEGASAVLTLAKFPRIDGWRDRKTLGQALEHWGSLANRVPILVARVPWGPPFATGLGAEVLEKVLAISEPR